jgi:hypothetical protein
MATEKQVFEYLEALAVLKMEVGYASNRPEFAKGDERKILKGAARVFDQNEKWLKGLVRANARN